MIRFLQSGNRTAKYLLGFFLVLLCLGMVVYLIPGFMTDANVSATGTLLSVAGQDIKTSDVQLLVDQIQQRQGQRYPDFMMPYLQQQALQQLVQDAEVTYEAHRMGLSVSDDELKNELRSGQNAQVLFPNGQWIGDEKYAELLRPMGFTPAAFEANLRKELLRNKLVQTVTAGVDVPESDIRKTYIDQNTKVKFDYALISSKDLEKQIKPTENELNAYYTANKAKYENSIPEKRQVKYFVIDQKQVENAVKVTPADLDNYYQQHKDEYQVPERVKARHILISVPPAGPDGKVDQKAQDQARAKAEDVLKQLKAGADFTEMANKYSEDPGNTDPETRKKRGGELGWLQKNSGLDPAFEKAVFAMNKGQISDPVLSSFGYHIIQVEDKQSAHQQSLDEVKDKIEPVLKQQVVATQLEKTSEQAQKQATAEGMDKAAAASGSHVVESGMVSRTDTLPGIGSSPQFMAGVFNAEPKVVEAARIPQGLAVFEVTKVQPARTPPFAEIRDKVISDFKAERAATMVKQKAQELADRAHAEHDLRKAAKEVGATVKSSDLVGREAQVPDLGSMSGPASAAFSLKKGEISGAIDAGSNGAVLAVTDRQEPAMGPDFDKARDGIREQLADQKRQEAYGLFLSDLQARLQKEGKIKQNKTELDALLKQRS